MLDDAQETKNPSLLLVAAHPLEFKEIRKKLRLKRLLTIGNPLPTFFENVSIELVLTGLGEKAVRSSLIPLFSTLRNLPKLVLSFGFAGALHSQMKLGDWILADEVKSFNANSKPLNLRDTLSFKAASEFFSSSNYPYHQGALVTAEKPVTDRGHKKLAITKAIAVDMEAYPILEIATGFKVPVLCFKIVSDYADDAAEKTLKSIGNSLSLDMANVLFDFLTFLIESKRAFQ